MAPRKYIAGIHTNSKIIDAKTNKALVTHIKAKSSCKKCYGRGFIGWYNEGGDQIKVWMCTCFLKIIIKYADKHSIMTNKIKIELFVDEEKTTNKIIIANHFNYSKGD